MKIHLPTGLRKALLVALIATATAAANTYAATINGLLHIEEGESLNYNESLLISGGDLGVNGSLTVNGNLTVQDAGVELTGDIASSGTIIVTGNQSSTGHILATGEGGSISVGGHQSADQIIATKGAQMSTGSQQATDLIGAENSNITVNGDQSSGQIAAVNGAQMLVNGHQQTNNANISNDSHVTVNAQTTANNLSVIDISTLTIRGNHQAGSVDVQNQSQIIVGSAGNGSQVVTTGDVSVADSSAITVHGNQTLSEGSLSVSGASVVIVDGDQTLAKGSVSVNGAGSSISVAGNQTVNGDLSVEEGATVTVAGVQTVKGAYHVKGVVNTGEQKISGDYVLDGAGGVINGSQSADSITILNTKANTATPPNDTLTVTGDQSATKGVNIENSIVKVNGLQSAGTTLTITNGSDVTVGTEQSPTEQLANGKITVTNGTGATNLTVHGDQRGGAMEFDADLVDVNGHQIAMGDIIVNGGSVSVEKNQTSLGGNIDINGGAVTVGQNQKATAGEIDIDNATLVDVTGTQEANDIFIENSGTVNVGAGQIATNGITLNGNEDVNITGNQKAENGNINVSDTDLFVSQEQIAGADIVIDGSSVDIDGNQQATKNIVLTNNDTVAIGGRQEAEDNIVLMGNTDVTIEEDQISVGGQILIDSTNLTIEGEQSALTDITVQNNSQVNINGGNQTALEGNILIDSSGVNIEDGNQVAFEGSISIVNTKNNDKEVVVNGDQLAENGIIGIVNSDVDVTGEQTATNIVIASDSEVWVGGNQTATDGDITVTGATLDTVGNQLSDENIEIADNADVWVGGDQTATNGHITVTGSVLDVVGNQLTDEYIDIDGSEVSVGVDQLASGDITIDNSYVEIGNDQTAGGNIEIADNADVWVGGDQTATNGHITVTGSVLDVVGNQLAGEYIDIDGSEVSVGVDQLASGDITIDNSYVEIGNDQTAGGNIEIADNADVWVGGDQTATNGHITVMGSVLDVVGNQLAGEYIDIDGSEVSIEGDMEALGADAVGNHITIDDSSSVSVNGSMIADQGSVLVKDGSYVDIDDRFIADGGSLTVGEEGALSGSIVNINTDNAPEYDSVISSDIAAITVHDENVLNTGNVKLNDVALTVDGALNATDWQSNGVHVIDGMGSNEGELTVQENLVLTGDNTITAGEVTAINGDITIVGNNSITDYSVIETENADSRIVIVTGEGDQTLIEDSDILSEGVIAIYGENADNQAVITGDSHVISRNTKDLNGRETGIVLSNVALVDLNSNADSLEVAAYSGDIVLDGTVDITGAWLDVDSGEYIPDKASGDGTIMVTENGIVNMHNDSTFYGTLSSKDTTALIIKDGVKSDGSVDGDELWLGYSARDYHGVINVTADDGSEVVVDYKNDGVAMDARFILKDTNLTVTGEAFDNTADGVITLGSIDTTQDEGSRFDSRLDANAEFSSVAGELGSYTNDDNTRAAYQNIGSVLTVNAGHAGDTILVRDMALSEHTLIRADHELNADGTAAADVIVADGTINGNGARVFGTLTDGSAVNQNAIEEQMRIQIMSGATGTAFNEDMLYDVNFDAAKGTYQRDLLDRNVWVETTGDGVNLVYSKNYRSAGGKDFNQSSVTDALIELSDKRNHTEGTLAASEGKLDKLIDALDYTRSEVDAQQALYSVSGATAVLAQRSMLDSSRHHLDTLRQWIAMPYCTENTVIPQKGAESTIWTPTRDSNVWLAYTGGYDTRNGSTTDMGDYSRTYQGALLGYQCQINCNWALGIALGYEHSNAYGDATEFSSDTYFADLYTAFRTGRFDHRLSIGMGFHDFESLRGVNIVAAGHDFHELGNGGLAARSLNIGYEVSTAFELSSTATISPFLTVNYGYHSLNKLKEYGMGDADLILDYEDMNQLDVGLGARYAKQFGLIDGQRMATFTAFLALKAEFSARSPEAVAHFRGDDAVTWRVKGDERSPLYMQMGAGLNVPFADQWSASIGASAEFGSDRTAVNGNIGVSYSF